MMPIQVSLLTDEDYESTLATATAQKEAQRIQREKEDQIGDQMARISELSQMVSELEDRIGRQGNDSQKITS